MIWLLSLIIFIFSVLITHYLVNHNVKEKDYTVLAVGIALIIIFLIGMFS